MKEKAGSRRRLYRPQLSAKGGLRGHPAAGSRYFFNPALDIRKHFLSLREMGDTGTGIGCCAVHAQANEGPARPLAESGHKAGWGWGMQPGKKPGLRTRRLPEGPPSSRRSPS